MMCLTRDRDSMYLNVMLYSDRVQLIMRECL